MARQLELEIQAADIVHIHCIWEEIQHLAAQLAYKYTKPYVIRPCGMLDPWSLGQSKWKKKAMLALRVRRDLNHAAALHFTADLERDLVQPLGLVPPSIVESNGINANQLLDCVPPQYRLSHKFPQVEGRPVILFFSRLHPKKGPDILLESFNKVIKTWNPSIHGKEPVLVFVGPDELETESKLQAAVQQMGLQDDVLTTGLLTGLDKAGALQSADLFCLPSHQENFGIAVVEALAAGTPVLISDQVNIHEAITAAGVGQAVSLEGNAFSDALLSWMTQPELRQESARDASDWACRTYSWEVIAGHWAQDHYPKLLEVARRRR